MHLNRMLQESSLLVSFMTDHFTYAEHNLRNFQILPLESLTFQRTKNWKRSMQLSGQSRVDLVVLPLQQWNPLNYSSTSWIQVSLNSFKQ